MSRARSVSQLVGANTALGNTVITGTANVSGAVAFSNTLSVASNTLLGTTTTTNNLRLNQKLAVVTTGSGIYGGAALTSYPGTVNVSSIIDLQRSRGTTDGSMTAVASGDILGYGPVFRGADGTSFVDAAYIQGAVDGTVSTGVVPGRLTFNTSNTSGGNQEVMRIDSSGRATLPYQPSFWVALNNGTAATGTAVLWNDIKYNIGSGYNASNGRFTAPITGRYFFTTTGINQGNPNNFIELLILLNGTNVMSARGYYPSSTIGGCTVTGIINMSASDYVTIQPAVTPMYGSESRTAFFCGHLLS
jgi:hypothetical protein